MYHTGGGCWQWGRLRMCGVRGTWEIASPQIFHETKKTALKNLLILEKKILTLVCSLPLQILILLSPNLSIQYHEWVDSRFQAALPNSWPPEDSLYWHEIREWDLEAGHLEGEILLLQARSSFNSQLCGNGDKNINFTWWWWLWKSSEMCVQKGEQYGCWHTVSIQ